MITKKTNFEFGDFLKVKFTFFSLFYFFFELIDISKLQLEYSLLFQTDVVCCFSTAPGNYAVRDREGSSPFIQSFCKEIQKKKRQTVFQEIINYKYLNFFIVYSCTFYFMLSYL